MRQIRHRTCLLAFIIAIAAGKLDSSGVGNSNVGKDGTGWFYTSSLDWYRCSAIYNITDPVYDLLNNTDCANLTVPLNWNNPLDHENVTLVLTRLKANGTTKQKIGSMVINPGGPGSRGTFLVGRFANQVLNLSQSVRESFDVIGLDPRGVGLSSPLQCDGRILNRRINQLPKTQKDLDDLITFHKDLGDSCRKLGGKLVDFMDSESVAHDIEAIRIALGGEKLTFVGVSYGTVLGVQYAELYPKNIRAMLLDSVVDRSQDYTYEIATSAVAFKTVLERFFDWCKTSPKCAWYGKDAPQLFDDLVKQALERPLPAPDCKGIVGDCPTSDCQAASGSCRTDVTATDLLGAVAGGVERRDDQNMEWTALSQDLELARQGNASVFSEGIFDPKTPLVEAASEWAGLLTYCQDSQRYPETLPEVLQLQQLASAVAPRTMGIGVNFGFGCVGWPTKVTNPPHPVNITDAPPILLTNSYWDMATPYPQAVNVHEQIKGSVLVSVNREGHVWYYFNNEVTVVADDYLVNLKMPPPNTVVTPSGR